MSTVLVTGGAGYIGSHTCKALAAAGFLPITFDNLSRGNLKSVQWGPLVVGDIADRETLSRAIQEYQPVAAIHFAAFAYVGESVDNPSKYYHNNVHGSLCFFDTLRDHNVDKIVFSSTCATYGSPNKLPITESTHQEPVNPYGHSKLMTERILLDFDHAYNLRSVALRYFNACGADPDGEVGEWHSPETHLIPRALLAAAGTIDKLTVFGDDYPTPDGTCIRDYIHVSDLATAHVSALHYLLSGGQTTAINLGAGRGVSVREILTAIYQVTGHEVPVVFSARREGDPSTLYADLTRAKSQLAFEPKFSDLPTIINTAWRFLGPGSI